MLQLPKTAIWILVFLLLLPWLVLLYVSGRLSSAPGGLIGATPAANAEATAAENANFIYHCKPGPWGEVQYNRIVIEPPETLINAVQSTARPIVWSFVGYSPATLVALLQSAGLTDAQLAWATDTKNWETTSGAILLHPDKDFILSLSPEARATLYTALAEFEENIDQNDPYRFRAEAADEWFAHSDLRPETIDLVKRLLYRRGTSLLFSDIHIVLPTVPSLQERTRLIKTLARKSTLLVKLRIRGNSNIDALDNYWGRGQRGKDIKPLLQSLVREGGNGTTIDIIHLLPRIPRSLLYTYPSPTEPGARTYLDCHWTVLNFFNVKPDDRFQQLDAVTAAFINDYYPVTGSPTLGDVLLFAKPNGAIIHSCVYIADDIVYTKNGASPNAPWILMSLSDVVAFYPSREPLDIQYYRAKSTQQVDNN